MKTYHSGASGKIIYLNEKGWGFINSHNIPFEKIYFHWSALVSGKAPNFKELNKGAEVKFNAHLKTLPDGVKKWKAIQVEVIQNGPEEVGRNRDDSGEDLEVSG